MRNLTSLQISKFYDSYKDLNVTFTKDVIAALGFKADKAILRCGGSQWSCIINSASMLQAKIICELKSEIMSSLQKEHQSVSLRFAFNEGAGNASSTFFVSGKIINLSTFQAKKNNFVLISIEYTQKAPDDLIANLGLLLEANINATKRSAERLILNDDNIYKIGLLTRDTFVFIQGIPRRCILIDISFSGVKLVLVGIANFLMGQETTVKFEFDNPQTSIGVKGKVVRAEHVEGRKDLIAIGINFNEEEIPNIFKMHLNKFFGQHKISKEV
ncbi:MAG: PilZ domain-containing protein [Treponemataceae bacterium]